MEPHLKALEGSKYCSLWHDQPDVRPEILPSLSGNKTCELLIVGGGFTGLWAALQAKERRPGADIILIEKTFVSDGASGRNGGFLSSNLAHGETNADYQFPGEGDKIDELGLQNLEELVASLEKYGIDARYENVGVTEVATNEPSVERLRAWYEEEKADGNDAVWYDQDAMRAEVNSPTYLAGIRVIAGKGGVLDPARLCWGLKKTILKLGVRIFEGTALTDIKPLGKTRMRAFCPHGTIESDKVLMATNAYRNPMREVRSKTIPIWDYQLATEPLNEAQLESIGWHKSRHALANDANMFHYYRFTKDNRITWGGGGSVCYYFNNNTDPSVADDRPRFEQLSQEFFETFPQLAGVKFSHRWSGIIATSTRFCMVPGVAYDGRVAWAVGYTGLGVGATRFGARVGIELLGYDPSDILDMEFIKRKPIPWAPEPFRWLGVTLTRHALIKADKNHGKRGLWLKLLDKLHLGFAC